MCRFAFRDSAVVFPVERVCKGNFHEYCRIFCLCLYYALRYGPMQFPPAAIVRPIGAIVHSLTFAFCVTLMIGMVGGQVIREVL